MRLKSNQRLYLIFLVVSIVAATSGTFLLSRFMNPYRLEVLEHLEINKGESSGYIIYHDFDKDG